MKWPSVMMFCLGIMTAQNALFSAQAQQVQSAELLPSLVHALLFRWKDKELTKRELQEWHDEFSKGTITQPHTDFRLQSDQIMIDTNRLSVIYRKGLMGAYEIEVLVLRSLYPFAMDQRWGYSGVDKEPEPLRRIVPPPLLQASEVPETASFTTTTPLASPLQGIFYDVSTGRNNSPQ